MVFNSKKILKFLDNYKYLLIIVLFGIFFLFRNSRENFSNEPSTDQLKTINDSLQSIIDCRTADCDSDKVRNFQEFKTKLNYPNFDILLFSELIEIKENGEELTLEKLQKIVNEDKDYADSFKLIEGMEDDAEAKANTCSQSIQDIFKAIEKKEAKHKEEFKKKEAQWNAEKAKWVAKFNRNEGGLWSSVCGLSRDKCEPVSAFFTIRKNHRGDHLLKYYRDADLNQCMRLCRNHGNCDWAQHRGNECWLKAGSPHSNRVIGFKTNKGMRVVDGKNAGRWGANKPNYRDRQSVNSCMNWCQGRPDCYTAVFEKSSGKCWLQHIGLNRDGMTSAYKNPHVNLKPSDFPDNHPWILQVIGRPKPVYKPPVTNIGDFICQDCRTQYAGQLDISDSQQVDIQSLQSCVGKLREGAQAPSPAAMKNDLENTDKISDVLTRLEKAEEARKAEDAKQTKKITATLGLGGGLGSSMSCISLVVVGVLVFMLVRKKK